MQNRLSRAAPRLPAAVTQQGVRVDKARSNFLLFTILSSDNPAYDPVALGDYASRTVLPEIQRIPGVGQAQLFGTERAMRIWIDPAKLVGFNLSTNDVVAAIRAQNAQVSSGTIGDLPTRRQPADQRDRRRRRPADHGRAVRRHRPARQHRRLDGAAARRRAHRARRPELRTPARLNGKPSTGIGVQLSPTGNALATADRDPRPHGRARALLPARGASATSRTTARASCASRSSQVVETLLEAVILVFLVMYLFLQNLRYTLIPTIVVPVSLLGAFGVDAGPSATRSTC